MRVLVACEFSGVVRDAFLELGHDAISCDLLPTENPGPHHEGDAIAFMWEHGPWDLVIAHPPCTMLCNSGVRWLYGGKGAVRDESRWSAMQEATHFFKEFQRAPAKKICIENPIPHKYARAEIGDYTQVVQPWWFGHGETKATCLWLTNLKPLEPTEIVSGRAPVVHFASPGPDRWKLRSATKPGFARAMARQWGSTVAIAA